MFSAIPGRSSCCTLPVICHVDGRTCHPWRKPSEYEVIRRVRPNAGFSMAPHSALAVGSARLQSGLKLRLLSVHVRAVLVEIAEIGLFARAVTLGSQVTYRPTVPFTAVLPLPNRSYAAPSRGSTSFQFGTSLTSGTLRPPGRNSADGVVHAGFFAANVSMRTPAFSVRRWIVHWSWT